MKQSRKGPRREYKTIGGVEHVKIQCRSCKEWIWTQAGGEKERADRFRCNDCVSVELCSREMPKVVLRPEENQE
jgi:hypothetical protein